MSARGPVLERPGLQTYIVESIQRFFDLAKTGLMKTDPAFRRKRRVISNAGYYLMHAEVLKIIDACTQVRDRVLIETLAFTGIRRAEVAGLAVDDILWKKGLLHIRHGKGDKQRFVRFLQDY
ncbi:MAG: tyrosine-type recombinase/integrase [Candidatus Zixiibacteriota bacterium]